MCKQKYAKAIDRSVFPGMQGGPHDHITAAKAVAFGEALKPNFKTYAATVIKNSKTLSAELKKLGFSIISDGTDNHLIVVDLTNKGITGKKAEKILESVGISVSRSTIPNDPNPPMNPSGIRLGTPALTTRGMKDREVKIIAHLINDAIDNKNLVNIKSEVKKLCKKFRVPGI